MSRIGVIGAGSWGTALATVLAGKGHDVTIWLRNKEQAEEMQKDRENKKYLPGVKLADNIKITGDKEEAAKDAEALLFSVPAQSFRDVFKETMSFAKADVIVINAAKGIEKGSLLRLSQVAEEIVPDIESRYAVISGPSHAEEVGRRLPTTVAVASTDEVTASTVQDLFFTDRFRTYIQDDVVGVELGGALKNIIALGAGISDGMGFGDNAKAALMTRGLAEIARLGIALGAKSDTFLGLTGVGDLIVTCTSMHSRNRRCGILIGQGKTPKEATDEIGMVVESMSTTIAAYGLAKAGGVEMPITEKIYEVINGMTDADAAVETLMGRERKHEKI